MTAKLYPIVPAVLLAISTAAPARSTASPFAQYNQANLANHGAVVRQYDQGSAIAMQPAYGDGPDLPTNQSSPYTVGDGPNISYPTDQQQLLKEPGYSVGTGAAHVGEGSGPSYFRDQELPDEPGYSVGTG